MAAARHREEVVNTVLAYALSSYGVAADPETIQRIESHGRRLPDVIFAYKGLRCVIEGKYADNPRAANELQAALQRRMDSGLAQVAIAIVYPKPLRTTPIATLADELHTRGDLEFQVLTEHGPGFWQTGGLGALLERLRHAQELLAQDDLVQTIAEDLSAALESAADVLISSPAACDRITEALGIGRPTTETRTSEDQRRQTAAKIATLTVANALIFHELLAAADERVTPLRKLISSSDALSSTVNHWHWICENINYVPIFGVAREILLQLPASHDSATVFQQLAKKALSICTNRAALRHDLMGRIYHYLLHEAKFLGTYYTSVGSANLLLKLALAPKDWPSRDFADLQSLNDFRVGDPACGTGTLLMASSQALVDNFVRARVDTGQPLDEKAFRNLHQTLMENVLYGYDVLQSAVHLSASTLALLAPEVSFRSMHLYAMPMGKLQGDEVRLGSIDFAAGERLPVQFDIEGGFSGSSEQITAKGSVPTFAHLPQLDLCVMNPPFTRSVNSNLLFGSVPDHRGQLQSALKGLVQDMNLSATITAGLGSVFIAIADRYIKPGGRLGLVIPAAISTGDSWKRTRDLLERRYYLETVVSSHDPYRWSFSENTDLSELLVVARLKGEGVIPPDGITYINLWKNVTTSSEAVAVAQAIHAEPSPAKIDESTVTGTTPIVVGNERLGEILALERTGSSDDWFGACFAQTDLIRIAWGLRRGYLTLPGRDERHPFPITALGRLATFGPDGRDIHDAFTVSTSRTAYPALWGTDSRKDVTLEKRPNRWLDPRTAPKPGRPRREPAALWPRAARLMISSRIWLETQRVVAVYLPEEALSNIWAPTRMETGDERDSKIIALWLNSTLGLTLLFSARVPTRGPWIQFKKPNLKQLPVLDTTQLSNVQKDELCRTYDALAGDEIAAFPDMRDCEVRRKIDGAIASSFDLPESQSVRTLLAREPIVSSARIAVEEMPEEAPQLQLFGFR